MSININQSTIYQGVTESVTNQHAAVDNAVNKFDTLGDIPDGFNGIARTKDSALIGANLKTGVESSRALGGSLTASAGTAAPITWQTWQEMETDFEWIRLRFESIEATAVVITSCGVGVADGSEVYPHTNGDAITAVTFGGAAKGLIPPIVSTNNPGILYSDWIRIKSLPRVDGGIYPWLITRVYFATPDGKQTGLVNDGTGTGTGYSYISKPGISSTFNAVAGQRKFISSSAAVDGVGTPASYVATAVTDNIAAFRGVEILSAKSVATIAQCGDSVSAGTKTIGDSSNACYMACLQATSAILPVSCLTIAWGGSTPAQYLDRSKALLATAKAAIAFYNVGSVNHPASSKTIADTHFAYALEFVRYCQSIGTIPVLETCVPQNLGSTGADVWRKYLNDRVRAITDLHTLDIDTIVSDPSAPYRFLPAYSHADNLHMVDAGHQACVPAKLAKIKMIFGMS